MLIETIPTEKRLRPIEIKRRPEAVELHICWSLWDTCNFNCSYCPDYNHIGTHQWLTKDHVINVIDQVRDHYTLQNGIQNIQISFTGGEPTLFKGFKEICHYLVGQGMTVGLTTNGSAGVRYWDEMAPLFDWICFSYHPEAVDEERLFSVLKLLHDREDVCLPAIRFMMHPDWKYWNQCLRFSDRVKREFDNWAIDYVELQPDFGVGIPKVFYQDARQISFLKEFGYEEQILRRDLIKAPKHPHDQVVVFEDGSEKQLKTNQLVNEKLINFFNWECDIGLESLYIDYSGNIFRAGCQEGGILGKVQQEEKIKFPTASLKCQKDWCWCGTNIMVSKRKVDLGWD